MMKRFSTDIKLITPYIIQKEILQIQKDKSKTGMTYQYDREVLNNEITNKKFKRFNNNYNKVLINNLCINSSLNNNSTTMIHHDFNNKQKFQRTNFSYNLEKFFEIDIFVKNGLSNETFNKFYKDISSIKGGFSHFSMMRNYNEEGPSILNALLNLTVVFSIMFSVISIKLYQKNSTTVQKKSTTKYALKLKEKKKIENINVFGLFFVNSLQIFNDDNSTLLIINSNEFNEINQYKNITKYIIISENIYSIPGNSFTEWPSVVSVNFGNSVTNIGIYVFSSCFNLETIIFGGNVTEIGGSSFSLCSSIKNITIPNSVVTIGNSAFAFCSNLTILTLGYGIREILSSAFGNCYNLQCIYYSGETEPDIGESAFYNVSTSVITYSTYKDNHFGSLGVIRESREGTCEPLPSHSFSQSNTFKSNTYTQSDSISFSELYSCSQSSTFPNSNTFTVLLQSDVSLSFSYTLTVTLSITRSLTVYETQTKSFSLYINNLTFSYIETEFIYYNYTIVIYSTYYNYYSNFFTMLYTDNNDNDNQNNDNKTTIIIISVCVIVIVIVIITLLIILLKHIRNKKEEIYENDKSEEKETETTNTFTTGISITNIEEDPFAEDFKEEKFIEQI